MSISPLLQGLNPAQALAVKEIDGPILVLAGPGSGKTRVLTHRIAYMIEQGIDPFSILAVTFTNKAAREMKERLDHLLGEGRSAALTVGTFHSICVRFLRRDIIHLGRERDFVIYDSDDQQRLMKQVMKELNIPEKKTNPRAVLSLISSAKNELVFPDEYDRQARGPFEEQVARCYHRYQKKLLETNACDFDDLLLETVRLFREHPEILANYQRRYSHILADEYQDTNRVQYLLLKLLAGEAQNLFVVGDEDQSIYAFRGADIRNIRSFEDDYPQAQVVMLEQNYRSTQSILDVAQAVISGSGQRKHAKQLWTENGTGTQVVLQEGYDQEEEAAWIADEIARLTASGSYRLSDCAVMYRTNVQSRAVEEAFIMRGVRYQVVGGTRFYERKEVRDALAYLRVCYNTFDGVSLNRIINWPTRGIGQRSEDELNRWAAELSMPVYSALQLLQNPSTAAQSPFASRIRTQLLAFLQLIDELIAAREEYDLSTLMEFVFKRVGFEEALIKEYGEEEGAERWENVKELRNIAVNYEGLPREQQLGLFLEEVALVADIDNLKEERDSVTCITLHQAKGLEYPVVFLIGLEEGLLPHFRSVDDRDSLEEERRLFYVGATRAKQRLYMLYAFRRVSMGRAGVSTPSRFLADIPKEMIYRMPRRTAVASQPSLPSLSGRSQLEAGTRRIQPGANRSSLNRASQNEATGERKSAFFPGQKVRHSKFGDGLVISTKLVEDDEEVTVSFNGQGIKRLLASFAKLETVS
jgi:DNA helicase-2/ATP-dependent DNA helicase PcrA